MRIVVIGAGLAGVTSAWYLLEAGHEVVLVDRQPGPGLETSYANGGQISVSHPEPWANPGAPLTVLRWLGREDAPLKFRPHLDWSQWRWGLQFLLECLPGRSRRNGDAIAALALDSRARLRALRESLGLAYDQRNRGILHLFFDRAELRKARGKADWLRALGMNVEVCDAQRCRAIEPALDAGAGAPLGGLYAADDESGDAHLFVRALTERAIARGLQVHWGYRVRRFDTSGGRIIDAAVVSEGGRQGMYRGDAYVLAAGAYSPAIARTVGSSLPIYPVKGYSVTLPLDDPAGAPEVSITDESRRIVCSRLGNRLRIAGTAELDGFNLDINGTRCRAILARAQELFPGLRAAGAPQFWAGLRPATPNNLPVIGRSRIANLFYNTGHGTLGWTLACGSAHALARIVSNERPEVDFPFRRAPGGRHG
jgi:D-amino-acid dehydrogenase